MQNLTMKDYETIKRAIIAFNSLGEAEQKAIKAKIDQDWFRIYDEYSMQCLNDKEWAKLYKEVKKYKDVTSFDMKKQKQFQRYVGDFNPYDPDLADHMYVYDPELYQQTVDTYQHFDKDSKIINDKISKIKHKKFMLNRNKKLRHLESELNEKKAITRNYANLIAQESLKDDYLATKTSEYNDNKTKLYVLSKDIATQIICQELKRHPGIACIEHNAHINDSDYYNSNAILNEVCNEIRDDAMDLVVKAKEKETIHIGPNTETTKN